MSSSLGSIREELDRAMAVTRLLVTDYFENHDRRALVIEAVREMSDWAEQDYEWLDFLLAVHTLITCSERPSTLAANKLATAGAMAEYKGHGNLMALIDTFEGFNTSGCLEVLGVHSNILTLPVSESETSIE